MKAAVYRGPHNIKIENVPEPEVKGRRVLVKFLAGSICGTDMHFYRGEWKLKRGRILGHDACAVREDTGERVVMVPVTNCGHCYYCLQGHPALCTHAKHYGLTRNGFFAETKAMPPRTLIPVPPSVTDEEAAIVEPVALAVKVLNQLNPNLDEWVTVLGQGAIGLLMTQIALMKGCRVIAVDTLDYRLELAEKYGADAVLNAKKQDIPQAVHKLTKQGSDCVIEAAGTKVAVEKTPFLARKGGRVALVGESEGYLNLSDADETQIFTTYLSPAEYPKAVDLIARKLVDVKELVTHRFKLEDFEKALATANNFAEKPLKVIITK